MLYGIIIDVGTTPPPTVGTPVWATILIAAITVLGGGLGWNVYKRWRTGATDDALQISQAAIEQARGAKDLFVEYRVELEAAQKQISGYLDQLIQVNRLLGESTARITRLEAELIDAKGEHAELLAQLDKAKREKEATDLIRERILKEMESLREKIRKLESGASSTHDETDKRLEDLERR
jgi:chromosome segregation ATPase